MHFATMTGAAMALTASLASATPITKRQSSIDPTKAFTIDAFSIPAKGSNAIETFTLTSFYSSTADPNQLGLQVAESSADPIATFTLDQSQLILYASPICEDPNGGCPTSQGFGDLYPNQDSQLTFQAGPYSPTTGGFAINNENRVVVPEDTNTYQFSICPSGAQKILTYEATGPDCVLVELLAAQPSQ